MPLLITSNIQIIKGDLINSSQSSLQMYKDEYTESIKNKENYYSNHARNLLSWDKPFTITHNDNGWFADGYLNACYNLIDRHCSLTPYKTAVIYETNEGETVEYTFLECQHEVIKIANYLKYRLGDKKVCVAIYMPNSDQLLFTVLACARLGLPHNVIFSGFTSESISLRVKDSGAKIIFTNDKARREKKVIDLYSNVMNACFILGKENYVLDCVIVYDKNEVCHGSVVEIVLWNDVLKGEIYEKDEIRLSTPKKIKTNVDDSIIVEQTQENKMDDKMVVETEKSIRKKINVDLTKFVPCVPVRSDHELFYLYTSGSTGKPKGLVHTTGGYLTYAALTTQKAFDVRKEDVFCSTADVGWITGHTYSIYGPLALGCTIVLLGGIPTFPSSLRSFEIVEKHKITHFYTAPTVIRMLQKKLGVVKTEFKKKGSCSGKKEEEIINKNMDNQANENESYTKCHKDKKDNKIIDNHANVNESDTKNNKRENNDASTKQVDIKTNQNISNDESERIDGKVMDEKRKNRINEDYSGDKSLDWEKDNRSTESQNVANNESKATDKNIRKPSLPENMLSSQFEMTYEEMQKYESSSFYRPNNGFVSSGYDLSSLRILGTVGEPINREAYIWYKKAFGPYLPVIDTYWQTEAGGIMISAVPYQTYPVPECACVPFYGMQPMIATEAGEVGPLVFKGTWPGLAKTIINDHQRYLSAYFSQYPGYFYTGDQGCMINDYFFIRGREDDVLNIAGHRMSTAEIESACCSNEMVVETAAIGVKDEITGQALVLFCVKKSGKDEVVCEYVKQTLREKIGPIARAKMVFVVAEVPKTRTGKIMRRVLRDIIEGKELGDLSTCNNLEAIKAIQDSVQSNRPKRDDELCSTIIK